MKALLDYNQDKDTVCFYRDIENSIRYYVNINGEVFLSQGEAYNKIPSFPVNGELSVFIRSLDKIIRVANIINFAFKGLVFSEIDDLLEREIIYIDMDKTNLHPSNLMWGNRNVKPDKDGFVLIPGFSNYRINKEGVVINRRGKVIKNFGPVKRAEPNAKIYIRGSIRSDVSKLSKSDDIRDNYVRLVNLHRLLAQAFIPIPLNAPFKGYDVNHIDGNILNNTLENLEWVTRRENNLHAVRNGLIKNVNPVLAREFSTGKILDFASIGEAARYFGVHKTKITTWCKTKGKRVFPNGHQFTRKIEFDNKWGDKPYCKTDKSNLSNYLRMQQAKFLTNIFDIELPYVHPKTNEVFSNLEELREYIILNKTKIFPKN